MMISTEVKAVSVSLVSPFMSTFLRLTGSSAFTSSTFSSENNLSAQAAVLGLYL